MREIKFRGWNQADGRMYPNVEASYDMVAHPDFKLMQYTGLKDKNAKEIYEGDIVKHVEFPRKRFEVEYLPPRFELRNMKDETVMPLYHNGCLTDFEIIGNIYENPELLSIEAIEN